MKRLLWILLLSGPLYAHQMNVPAGRGVTQVLDLSGGAFNSENFDTASDTDLARIIELDISMNDLTEIPTAVLARMPNLEILKMDGNPIETLRTLPVLSNLKELYVSGTNISTVSSMPFLRRLRRIWARDNELDDFRSQLLVPTHDIEDGLQV